MKDDSYYPCFINEKTKFKKKDLLISQNLRVFVHCTMLPITALCRCKETGMVAGYLELFRGVRQLTESGVEA